MVGKNNYKLKREKASNKFYRYSIKRLSVGVASVAVSAGFLFAGRDAVQVKAAEVLDGEENALTQGIDQSDGDGLQLEEAEENPAPETFSETVEEPVEEPAASEEAEVTSEDSAEETDASPAEESAGQVEEEAPVSGETTGAEEGLETEAAETQESEEQVDGETAEAEESAESLDLPESPAELASEETEVEEEVSEPTLETRISKLDGVSDFEVTSDGRVEGLYNTNPMTSVEIDGKTYFVRPTEPGRVQIVATNEQGIEKSSWFTIGSRPEAMDRYNEALAASAVQEPLTANMDGRSGFRATNLYQSGRNINGEVPATYNSGDTNGNVGEKPGVYQPYYEMTVEDESYETEFIVTDIDGNYSYTDRSGRTFTGTIEPGIEKIASGRDGRVQVLYVELYSDFYNELTKLTVLYQKLAQLYGEFDEPDEFYAALYQELVDEFDEELIDEFYQELVDEFYQELVELYELYEFDGNSFTEYSPTEFVNRFVDGRLVTEDGSYIERDGRYWREVSRERLVESQPEIFVYNPLSIVDTEYNDDGGVTIHYNDGSTVTIPGPEKPEQPNPAPMVTVRPDTQDGRTGNTVIVETWNPELNDGEGGYEITSQEFIPDGQDGEQGEQGESGRDGNYVEVVENGDGTYNIIVRDGETGEAISSVTVRDGKDGEQGEQGEPGQDGRSITAQTERGELGSRTGTWVNIYELNPDGTRGALLDREFIFDGEDGRSVTISTERGDHAGRPGTWVIVRDRDTGAELDREFIFDGTDGTSITGYTEPGELDGRSGVWLTLTDEAGNIVDRTFIFNGLDGESPTISTQVVVDPATGVEVGFYVTIENPDGTTTREFVRHGRDGVDGENGQDGRSITSTLIDENGNLVIVYSDGQIENVGRVVGEDDESPTITTTPITNEYGVEIGIEVTITNPDGSYETVIVRHGKDGQDGSDGNSVIARENEDGSVTIIERDSTTGEEKVISVIRDGQDGALGKDGRSITTTLIDEHGDLIMIYSDGQVENVGRVVGRDGQDGQDGQSPTISTQPILNENGQVIGYLITIHNADGTSNSHPIFNSQDGIDGQSPVISVESVVNLETGEEVGFYLVIENADGSVIREFVPFGKDGQDGRDGQDGELLTQDDLLQLLEQLTALNVNINISIDNSTNSVVINTGESSEGSMTITELEKLLKQLTALGVNCNIIINEFTQNIIINVNQDVSGSPTSPGTDEPGSETPGTDEPGNETPGTDEPGDGSSTETPGEDGGEGSPDQPDENDGGTPSDGDDSSTNIPGQPDESDGSSTSTPGVTEEELTYTSAGVPSSPRTSDWKFVSSPVGSTARGYSGPVSGQRLPDTATLTWVLGLVGASSLLGGSALAIKDRKKK